MQWLKRLCRALLFPPPLLTVLIAVPSFGLLIYVFASGLEEHWLAYVSYGLSAWALTIVSLRIPDIIHAFRTGFAEHPQVTRVMESDLGRRYRGDALFRAEVSLYAGLCVNLLYALVKAVFGVMFRSLWFGALAAYYLLLALMRFALAHHVLRSPAGQDPLSEWKRCMLCGGVLLMMNQALAVVVALVVYRGGTFRYPGILIYVMAMYTFYAFTVAIINMVKYRRHFSPVMFAAKAISLVAALVSMLSLETAMLAQFGSEDNELFRRILTGVTGSLVCIAVLALAIVMLIRSRREIRRLKHERGSSTYE